MSNTHEEKIAKAKKRTYSIDGHSYNYDKALKAGIIDMEGNLLAIGERGSRSPSVIAIEDKGYTVTQEHNKVGIRDKKGNVIAGCYFSSKEGWWFVTNHANKTHKAGSQDAALHWLSSVLPKLTQLRKDIDMKDVARKAAKTKRNRALYRKPSEKAPIQNPKPKKEKICPVCNKKYTGRNRTCGQSCANKKSALASAEASEQMRLKNGEIYNKWKKGCDNI